MKINAVFQCCNSISMLVHRLVIVYSILTYLLVALLRITEVGFCSSRNLGCVDQKVIFSNRDTDS